MAQRQFHSSDTDAWLDRYGEGGAGDVTISTPTTADNTFQARASATGTISTKSVTASTTDFANGDIVVIIKMSGTDAGHWELNKVASGGGTVNLTMEYDLTLSYTDSGDNQTQMIALTQYQNLTINSTITGEDFQGSIGGIVFLLASESISGNGTISVDGQDGFDGGSGQPSGGADGGFRGGAGNFRQSTGKTTALQGEGTGGVWARSTAANGNGGGGGRAPDNGINTGSGGGGGHASSGGNGSGGSGGTGGTGGGTAGNQELTLMVMGGGGGGGSRGATQPDEVSGGGSGGGIVVLIAPEVDISGMSLIDVRGGDTEAAWWPGGGGAGGSILIKGRTVNIGTNKLRSEGGTSISNGDGKGGDGGDGRIAIYYGDGGLTGSVSSSYYGTYSATEDSILNPELAGGAFLYNFV